MGFGKWVEEEFGAEVRHQAVVALIQLIAPFGMAVVTLASNWLGAPIPWPYVIGMACLAFGMTANGIFHVRQQMYQNDPEGKLRISGVVLGKMFKNGKLSGIKYGLQYTNQGWFPIELKVFPKQVSLGGNINPNPQRDVTGAIAQIGAIGTFFEAVVPVSAGMKNHTVEGILDVEIKYGRIGKLEHKFERKYRITVQFQQNGDVQNYESTELMSTS